ncbi:MAG: hypothetical protein QM751_16170 [Paludibacteraceae bacterium]
MTKKHKQLRQKHLNYTPFYSGCLIKITLATALIYHLLFSTQSCQTMSDGDLERLYKTHTVFTKTNKNGD